MIVRPLLAAVTASLLTLTSAARASDSPARADEGAHPVKDVRAEIPILAFAYTAYGASQGSVGAEASGVGLGGARQRALLGGGATAWVSPVDRLTLIADAQRNVLGNFAPSFAAVVRLLGTPSDGWSLGALGKFNVEGFGIGPKREVESEIETGILVSYARAGWHFDANGIGGMGTGDDGEVDAEARARIGRDIGRFVRVGLDGQARSRLAGARRLAGNRLWDFAGGPQVIFGSRYFFGALTAGPATMGVLNGVGWTAIASVGGTTL